MPTAAPARVQTDISSREWLAGPWAYRAAAAGIAVMALGIRLLHLRQPMRLDEARTFLDYAIRPLPDAISNYNIPNNHLLHTLLVWISIRLFGHGEWAVRLPAFLAGLCIVAATYVATRRLADRGAALIAVGLAAVLPVLVLYSTNARGYSMVCLAFVVLIPLVDALADEESLPRWAAFGLLVALGAVTIPVMLYPAGAASLWLLVERARRQGTASALRLALRLAGVLAVAGAIAALAYVPAIQRFGAESITGNKFVAPYSWPRFVEALPPFARRLRSTIGLGIPKALFAVLVLCGLLPLVVRGAGRSRLLSLAATTAVWCIVLLVATRRAPPPRVWLFLAPLWCLLAGIGLALAARWLADRLRVAEPTLVAAAALLLPLGIGAATVASRIVVVDNESAALVDGPDIARYLLGEVRAGDRLVVSNMVSPEVDYYLFTMAGRRFADLESPSRSARVLLVLNHRESQTPATVRTERPDLDWSRYGAPVRLRTFPSASVWQAPRRGE